MSEREFTSPPEPDVYGPDRVDPPAVPPEFVDARRHRRHQLRAGALPGRVPDRDRRALLHRVHLGREDRGGVRGDHGDEPVLVGLRPRLRRALRAGLPPGRSDGPLAIRNLKRYVMDKLGATYRPAAGAGRRRRRRSAIVGGGPAGLTAAQDLAEAGYEVHVYEMTDMLGGYMTWGIPAFRCPPEVFQEDIDRILARCPGITVHLGRGRSAATSRSTSSRSATTPSC